MTLSPSSNFHPSAIQISDMPNFNVFKAEEKNVFLYSKIVEHFSPFILKFLYKPNNYVSVLKDAIYFLFENRESFIKTGFNYFAAACDSNQVKKLMYIELEKERELF